MDDIFKILPIETVNILEEKLEKLFNSQTIITSSSDITATDPSNSTLKANLETSVTVHAAAVTALESVSLSPIYILKNYKGVEEDVIRTLNRYYA